MQGHIRKRGRASWTVVADLGRDPVTSKRKQLWRSVKGTRREAEALLVHLLHQRDTGIDAPSGRLTVADYLQQWLSTYSQPNLAPKTHIRYEQLIRIHIVPVLGNIPLSKLRPLHIPEVYKQVREKGLSARTALHCHRVLKEALQHALRWQLITRNPAEAVDPPTPERHQVPALHPEEVKRLLTISWTGPPMAR